MPAEEAVGADCVLWEAALELEHHEEDAGLKDPAAITMLIDLFKSVCNKVQPIAKWNWVEPNISSSQSYFYVCHVCTSVLRNQIRIFAAILSGSKFSVILVVLQEVMTKVVDVYSEVEIDVYA